jgi:hypothetical protein
MVELVDHVFLRAVTARVGREELIRGPLLMMCGLQMLLLNLHLLHLLLLLLLLMAVVLG